MICGWSIFSAKSEAVDSEFVLLENGAQLRKEAPEHNGTCLLLGIPILKDDLPDLDDEDSSLLQDITDEPTVESANSRERAVLLALPSLVGSGYIAHVGLYQNQCSINHPSLHAIITIIFILQVGICCVLLVYMARITPGERYEMYRQLARNRAINYAIISACCINLVLMVWLSILPKLHLTNQLQIALTYPVCAYLVCEIFSNLRQTALCRRMPGLQHDFTGMLFNLMKCVFACLLSYSLRTYFENKSIALHWAVMQIVAVTVFRYLPPLSRFTKCFVLCTLLSSVLLCCDGAFGQVCRIQMS